MKWNIPNAINGELIRYEVDIYNMELYNSSFFLIEEDLLRQTIVANITYLPSGTNYYGYVEIH